MAVNLPAQKGDNERDIYKILVTGNLYAETLEGAAKATKEKEQSEALSEKAATVRRDLLYFREK